MCGDILFKLQSANQMRETSKRISRRIKLEYLTCNTEDVIRNLRCFIIYTYTFSMPGRPVRFGGFRDADKENHGPPISQHHEDDSDEEDGHILYRDDDESLEEEGKHFNSG